MSDDDSRDTKTPDRQDAPSISEHIVYFDSLTRTLLEYLHDPRDTALEHTPPQARAEIRRHVLEIRAQACQIAIAAVGPEAAIPYRPDADGPGTGLRPAIEYQPPADAPSEGGETRDAEPDGEPQVETPEGEVRDENPDGEMQAEDPDGEPREPDTDSTDPNNSTDAVADVTPTLALECECTVRIDFDAELNLEVEIDCDEDCPYEHALEGTEPADRCDESETPERTRETPDTDADDGGVEDA
ncbi:hypothetical protein G6M89_08760 [Natronolimnobius sp. AArcel1]|uniref:hypothetical protein n=1 Tax=Natronolimnobius sp. AArcel1 TaxID=1679093 RepID=UPI0013EC4F47|nr:hypothetical protein [Natronolimnobius sp. AArcel1]NGM69097.1 hypothetical protein [Natronolimnobius sp. AArcel1]